MMQNRITLLIPFNEFYIDTKSRQIQERGRLGEASSAMKRDELRVKCEPVLLSVPPRCSLIVGREQLVPFMYSALISTRLETGSEDLG